MERQRDSLVPIGEAISGPGDPVEAIHSASPKASHHFTQADQANQLVGASEASQDLGFMARLMALCSLPRTNPGNQTQYVRRNGPYTLIMFSSGKTKLPFGNLPRLLLALGLNRFGADPKPRVGPGGLSCRVHAEAGYLQQQWGKVH